MCRRHQPRRGTARGSCPSPRQYKMTNRQLTTDNEEAHRLILPLPRLSVCHCQFSVLHWAKVFTPSMRAKARLGVPGNGRHDTRSRGFPQAITSCGPPSGRGRSFRGDISRRKASGYAGDLLDTAWHGHYASAGPQATGALMAEILVVEDERLLRVMLKDAVEGAGHAVVLAENGRLAIDRAQQVGAAAGLAEMVGVSIRGLAEGGGDARPKWSRGGRRGSQGSERRPAATLRW